MERHVLILKTNADDALKSATRLFVVSKDQASPRLIDVEEGRGQSIPEFFGDWGISLQTMIELFPDCFGTVEPYDGSGDWETPLIKQILSHTKPDLIKLATLLGITVFIRVYNADRQILSTDSARPVVTDWLFEKKKLEAGASGFVVFHMKGGNVFRIRVDYFATWSEGLVSFFTDASCTQANILRFDTMKRIEVEEG